MFWYFFGVHPGATLDWARRAASWAAELWLLAATVRATVARPSNDDPDGRLFCLWIMTAILVSPTSWFYYLVLLTIPIVRLSAAAANNRTSARFSGPALHVTRPHGCTSPVWICIRAIWRCIPTRLYGELELRRWRCSHTSRFIGSQPIPLGLVSLRCGRSSAAAENLDYL